jgi:hypothetical protein
MNALAKLSTPARAAVVTLAGFVGWLVIISALTYFLKDAGYNLRFFYAIGAYFVVLVGAKWPELFPWLGVSVFLQALIFPASLAGLATGAVVLFPTTPDAIALASASSLGAALGLAIVGFLRYRARKEAATPNTDGEGREG